MRFRNPTVAVLALAIPCTWVLARQPLTLSAPAGEARPSAEEIQPPAAEAGTPVVDPSRSSGKRPLAAAAPVRSPAPLASPPPSRPPLTLLADPTRLELEAGEHAAPELVARWAGLLGLTAQVDAQVAMIRLRLETSQTLDREALRALLDAHDLVLVRRVGVLHAVHRRNLAVGFGPPWALVEDAPADPDALVTRVVQVRHGAGNTIFAVLRGLMTRDTNRVGNILYVAGPERILLCDFARNVRYYEQVIAALDQPAVANPAAAGVSE